MDVEDDDLTPEEDDTNVEDLTEIDDTGEDLDDTGEDLDDEGSGNADDDTEASSRAADGDGSEAAGRQVRQPSRAARRVTQALREAKEAREEVARLRSEAQTRQSQTPQETPQQRDARLAEMDPEQRLTYLLREQDQRTANRLAQIEFQSADSNDRAAFEGLCARSPVASKLRGEVEDRLAELRRGGQTAPRETVLRYLIGDRALANAGRANGKAKARAADNTARQTVRPASSRSDVGAGRSSGLSEQAARAKRLEDVSI